MSNGHNRDTESRSQIDQSTNTSARLIYPPIMVSWQVSRADKILIPLVKNDIHCFWRFLTNLLLEGWHQMLFTVRNILSRMNIATASIEEKLRKYYRKKIPSKTRGQLGQEQSSNTRWEAKNIAQASTASKTARA